MAADELLRLGSERIRVSTWRGNAELAYIAPLPSGRPPSTNAVTRTVDTLAARGYRGIVTAALGIRERKPFLDRGFRVRELLHLLAHDLDDLPPAPSQLGLRRARRIDRAAVLELDRAAFSAFWRLDDAGLKEALDATPSSRFRIAERDGTISAYAICGRAGNHGYVQRLAVLPASEGTGFGAALVVDGLHWMRRRGVRQALVNTQLENQRALHLYERLGFVLQPDGLAVLEIDLEDQ